MNRSYAILAIAFLAIGLVAGVGVGAFTRPSATQVVTFTRVPPTQVVTTTLAPSTQYVALGQTWYYLAFYSPSLTTPPDSAGPGISFAVVNSDTSWTEGMKSYPELFLSPGQSKSYEVRLSIDSKSLPLTGRLLSVDGLGLGVHFSNDLVNGSAGGGSFTMTVSLADNFSWGVNTLQIPVIFSASDRIQPVAFGPIFLVSGFPGTKVTGAMETGQPTIAFQDDAGRGYAVDLITRMNNTLMLSGNSGPPSSGSVCAGLDSSGGLLLTRGPAGFPCEYAVLGHPFSVALRPGQTTSFVLAFKLVTQLGVQLGFSVNRYGSTLNPSFSVDFSPSTVTLRPGVEVDVTVTVRALAPASEPVGIDISAVTLEGTTVGLGTVYSFGLIVVVTT